MKVVVSPIIAHELSKISKEKLINGKEEILPFLYEMKRSNNPFFVFLQQKFVLMPPTYRRSPEGVRIYKDDWITKNFIELSHHLNFDEKKLITEDSDFRDDVNQYFGVSVSWEQFSLELKTDPMKLLE